VKMEQSKEEVITYGATSKQLRVHHMFPSSRRGLQRVRRTLQSYNIHRVAQTTRPVSGSDLTPGNSVGSIKLGPAVKGIIPSCGRHGPAYVLHC